MYPVRKKAEAKNNKKRTQSVDYSIKIMIRSLNEKGFFALTVTKSGVAIKPIIEKGIDGDRVGSHNKGLKKGSHAVIAIPALSISISLIFVSEERSL